MKLSWRLAASSGLLADNSLLFESFPPSNHRMIRAGNGKEGPELVVKGLTQSVGPAKRIVWSGVSFKVGQGERLTVQGASGAGKSLLLRTLASLDAPLEGQIVLRTGGKEVTWEDTGIPAWRGRVSYVSQNSPTGTGTPQEYFKQVVNFKSQRGRTFADPEQLSVEWGLAQGAFDRSWSSLSGGERQRAYLAIAVALKPDVLLLDEPTSALDPTSVLAVERSLVESSTTTVWVTHNQDQANRVATSSLYLDKEGTGYRAEQLGSDASDLADSPLGATDSPLLGLQYT